MTDHDAKPASDGETGAWLDQPRNVTKLVWALIAVCVALFFADGFYEKHGEVTAEYLFGFYGIYGFTGCVALVLAAKWLRTVVMRREDYYDTDASDGGNSGGDHD